MESLGTPERARFSASYFKTGPGQYGAGDRFAGLSVGQIRALEREHRNLALADIEQLLHSEIHEARLLALVILVRRYGKGDLPLRQQIFDLYLRNTASINNWDLVDSSAPGIVGTHLQDGPKELLDSLARSENLWERRIAIIATLHYLKQGDPEPSLHIAAALLQDGHDLIHKAVGWALREVGKRCGRSYLTAFLDEHAATMPRTTLRYAIEHFSPEERRYYLALRARLKTGATPPGNSARPG